MRNLIIIMALALLATSCKELAVEDMFYPEDPEVMVEKTADFTVRLTREDLEHASGIESAFREKAMEECFVRTARKAMQFQPLLKGSYASASHPNAEFARFRGIIKPTPDDLTDDLIQNYQCSLKVYPYFSLAGEVVGLEEERTMVARGDRVVIILFGDTLPELPVYFLLGRKTQHHGLNLTSIYGSGRIVQIIGETAPVEGGPGTARTMARGVIMETSHEVAAKDLIFLTLMNVNALEAEQDDQDISATATADEVWVKPRVRDQESPPAEMK